MMINKVKGFLLISLAALMIVGSIIGLLVSHMVTVDHGISTDEYNSTEALYVATAGLQKATYALTTNVPEDLVECADITSSVDFTNVAFGDGYFTVTATESTANQASLTENLSSSATIIPVSSLTGYGNLGQVTVDSEIINYAGTSTSLAVCSNNAPCLVNATRGFGGTSAAIHTSGAGVTQTKCHLVSTAGVPNLSSPEGERILSQDVYLATADDSASSGWIVGNKAGSQKNSYEYILELSDNSWNALDANNNLPDVHLYGAYAVDANNAWIVGDKNSSRTTVFQWDGATWSRAATPGTPNKALRGVTCFSANNCWAVGDSKTFINWNGTAWSNGTVNSNVPNKRINGVNCPGANDCWAVGQNENGNFILARWSGTEWSRYTTAITVDKELYDIACTATNDCWAVGKSSTFIHWDGSNWNTGALNSNVPSKDIKSISCIDSNDCWAVGSKSSGVLILHWDGSEWSRVNADSSVPGKDLYAVDCANTNNCWATGQSGTITQWNGSSWIAYTATTTENKDLNAVTLYANGGGGGSNSAFVTNWNDEQNS